MKVLFEQSGGIVGVVRGCNLDTSKMSPAEAEKLESLVEQSDLRAVGGHLAEARDLAEYVIEVESQGRRIRAQLDEAHVTPALRPLVQFLQSCAKPRALR